MTLETKKFKNRFTDEKVLAVRFTGKQDQIIEILEWVIDNGGRAQGDVLLDGNLDLKVYERGVGMIKVKPGEFVVQSESGFEVHPVMTFTQLHEKVIPIMKVIRKPEVLDAMQFTGDIENENEIDEWLKSYGHVGSYRHNIPATTITYYRIEMADGLGSIDILLNNWMVIKTGEEIISLTNDEFLSTYQRVN